jgi:hypothetical protein
MQVERQSKSFPENQRWELGPAMFITLHVVGSNNNKVNEGYCATTLSPNRTQAYCEAANVEYAARNAANLEFLSQSFDLASEKGKKGILVAMQANPQFDVVLTVELHDVIHEEYAYVVVCHSDICLNRSQMKLLEVLRTTGSQTSWTHFIHMLSRFRAKLFLYMVGLIYPQSPHRPTYLPWNHPHHCWVTGDSHEYVFDKPFPLDSPTFQEDNQTAYDVHFGAVLSNFARVEVPGDHNIDWVLVRAIYVLFIVVVVVSHLLARLSPCLSTCRQRSMRIMSMFSKFIPCLYNHILSSSS